MEIKIEESEDKNIGKDLLVFLEEKNIKVEEFTKGDFYCFCVNFGHFPEIEKMFEK